MIRIFKLITPQSLENRAALRTAIATLVAVLIAFQFHLEKPFWAGMTVLLLANIYTGSIIDKAILRIIGTVVGAWFGYFLAGLVVNSLLLYLLANFLIISLAVYYYNFSSYAYAYLLGALGAFFVISNLAINANEAFLVAIWRPVEIGLGVLVSAVSAFWLFPNNIKDSLTKDVNLIFAAVVGQLEQLNKLLTSAGELSLVEIKVGNLQLKKKLRQSMGMIGLMRRELGIKRERIDQLRALLDQFYDLSRTITYFISIYKVPEKQEEGIAEISKLLTAVFAAMQHDLALLRNAFFTSSQTKDSLQTGSALAYLHQAITSSSDNLKADIASLITIKRYLDIEPLLQNINAVINNLADIFVNRENLRSCKNKVISSQQQLRNDSDIIMQSIKAGLSAVLALCFWLVSNWPGGLNGIISSLMISIRKNLFEMANISLYRLLGCIAGGSMALFPLAFIAMNLYDFIVILFFSIWGFSYFSFKSTKYGYIGLQANIALVIALAQAGGPPIELEPALERLAGVVIGVAANFLVANILWRADFFSMLSRHLHKLFRFLVYNMKELLLGGQKKLRLYDLTDLFWLCRSLLETFPEKYFKSKKQEKLTEAKRHFDQMVLIQATLSHIYESIDKDKAYATAANYDIALKDLEKAVVALYKANKVEDCNLINQQIDGILANIDLSSYYAKTPSKELGNCIAYTNALSQLKLLHEKAV